LRVRLLSATVRQPVNDVAWENLSDGDGGGGGDGDGTEDGDDSRSSQPDGDGEDAAPSMKDESIDRSTSSKPTSAMEDGPNALPSGIDASADSAPAVAAAALNGSAMHPESGSSLDAASAPDLPSGPESSAPVRWSGGGKGLALRAEDAAETAKRANSGDGRDSGDEDDSMDPLEVDNRPTDGEERTPRLGVPFRHAITLPQPTIVPLHLKIRLRRIGKYSIPNPPVIAHKLAKRRARDAARPLEARALALREEAMKAREALGASRSGGVVAGRGTSGAAL